MSVCGNTEREGELHCLHLNTDFLFKMANSWNNRVKFIVRLEAKILCKFLHTHSFTRYMYDYDGNGVLDQNDFECLAVRNTIMEGKGDWDPIK